MKFEPTRLAEYTDEALLAEIRRVANLINQPSLSTAAFTAHARVGLTTIRRRFGGWREALAARVSRTLARGWTRDQVIKELKRVAAVVGHESVTVQDFRQNAVIGPDAVRRRFGGWPQALRAAGLKPVNHGRRYSDEECFENLLSVWTHYGRQPKYREMNTAPSSVGGKAYTKRWGTWNWAIHAFTNHVESDTGPPSTEGFLPARSDVGLSLAPRARPEDRQEPSVGLRYRVLCRDRFRCVSCGRSPASEPGCKLHVDHVVPFSKGGKTTLDNLRALCAECNLGKGCALQIDA